MPACAWETSQKADLLPWSIYSLFKCVQVWTLYLCSPNPHLKYCYRCPKPENWISILCSLTEAKFNSVCSLWSLTPTVVLCQSRTRKSVSYLKSLKFHQKEKDHNATESNLSVKVSRKDLSLGAFKGLFLPSDYKEFMRLLNGGIFTSHLKFRCKSGTYIPT